MLRSPRIGPQIYFEEVDAHEVFHNRHNWSYANGDCRSDFGNSLRSTWESASASYGVAYDA